MSCDNIIKSLINNDCIKIGNFKLKTGDFSKYYFDMKNLVSHPELLCTIGDSLYELFKNDEFDLICGVPLGGLPVSSYISTKYSIPMIMVRDEVKSYGTNKQIEGNYKKTDRCIIIEDVVTSGGSVEKNINILKTEVNIIGVIVIIDRQQGYTCSIPLKSLINKTDIVRYKLKEIMSLKESRLCFSADLDNENDLIKILDEVGPYIVICKIHYDFYTDSSELKNSLISLSIKHNFLIMEDRKFVDISNTVKLQYKKFQNWVDMVTVVGNINGEVLKYLSGALLLANMSNNNYDYSDRCIDLSINYQKNIIGFITQKRLNTPVKNMVCMTPGVNLRTKCDGDQNYRTVDAIDTDIIIVGRGIYNQKNITSECIKYSKL